MAEPSLCTIVVGPASDFFGGATDIDVTVETIIDGGAVTITWAETAEAFVTLTGRFAADVLSAPPTFQVPHVDQPGFINGNTDEVTFWAYRATVTARRGAKSRKWEKVFQPVAGQTVIRLADIPDGEVTPGVTAPSASVTSVAGQSGVITSERLIEVLGPELEGISDEQVTEAVGAQDIPGKVSTAVAQADIPGQVATGISSSPTVTAAVKAAVPPAVDANIAGRSLAEVKPATSDEVAFGITDEASRRTWLEFDPAGKPTERAGDLIRARVGPAITADAVAAAGVSTGIQDQNTDITGLGFAVTDEGGRRTDLEVGADGHFTARVLAFISSQIVVTPTADPVNPIAPAKLSLIVGATYKLFFTDFIGALSKDQTVLTSGAGTDFGTYWAYTPAAATTFNLTLTVVDRAGATIRSKVVAVTVYAVPSGAGKRHLGIGDSITRNGRYLKSAVDLIPGSSTVGTRVADAGNYVTEGRGGWTLNQYMTQIGHALWGDSPFLFPVGVAAEKYRGNVNFWKSVCFTDPDGYDFKGFQKVARGWADSGPYLYGTDGYPTAPTEGDVVVDPSFATADRFRQYVSGAWVRMATQPAVEFNFTKYMARFAAAFPAGGPTSISLMLMTNDFFTSVNDSNFALWKSQLDTVIASVRAWSATVPFIVQIADVGGPWAYWGGQANQTKWGFDQNIRAAAIRILAAYDTPAALANKVHVTSILGAIDPVNLPDSVHPTDAGHTTNMAPFLAGKLAQLITEGA
jgi:hypothetical protein